VVLVIDKLNKLSSSERGLYMMILTGKSYKQLAHESGVTVLSITGRCKRLYKKLGRSRLELMSDEIVRLRSLKDAI
jgi:DNA-binding NarL/FixJ family response regulator